SGNANSALQNAAVAFLDGGSGRAPAPLFRILRGDVLLPPAFPDWLAERTCDSFARCSEKLLLGVIFRTGRKKFPAPSKTVCCGSLYFESFREPFLPSSVALTANG